MRVFKGDRSIFTLDMRDCFVHTFPGSLIELEFTGQENNFSEIQQIALILQAFDERTYELPFDRRNNGVWIYGSKNFKSEYPFTIQLYREFELLFIRIWIRWSLWTEYGSLENIALSRAISRIVAKGWQVSSSMELFGI